MREDDARLCLENCLYPDRDGCPPYCIRQGGSGDSKKIRGIAMLLDGKPEHKVALICGVKRSTVQRWSRELAREMEGVT